MNDSDISIYDLPINTRAKISLDLYGVKTVADLMLFTPEELGQISGIGVKSKEEIAAAIAARRRKQNE